RPFSGHLPVMVLETLRVFFLSTASLLEAQPNCWLRSIDTAAVVKAVVDLLVLGSNPWGSFWVVAHIDLLSSFLNRVAF
ncbi:hypothetical protein M8C21_031782, partial [Ambrosia artemisiifolia]